MFMVDRRLIRRRACHAGGVTDQAFHSTQTFRQGEIVCIAQHLKGDLVIIFVEIERVHSSKVPHLLFRQLVLRAFRLFDLVADSWRGACLLVKIQDHVC